MSHDDPRDWDVGMMSLLEAERDNITAPAEAESRVWGKLSGLPSGGGGGHPRAGSSGTHVRSRSSSVGSFSAKVTLGAYVLGVITGVGGATLVSHYAAPSTPILASPVVAPSAGQEPVRNEEQSPVAPREAVASSQDAAVAPVQTSAPRPSATTHAKLEDERIVLDIARTALGRGDGTAALGALSEHERRYPNGVLVEEREAMAIQALLLLGRYDDATQREAAFERKYPHSMLIQAMRSSIQSIPGSQ